MILTIIGLLLSFIAGFYLALFIVNQALAKIYPYDKRSKIPNKDSLQSH